MRWNAADAPVEKQPIAEYAETAKTANSTKCIFAINATGIDTSPITVRLILWSIGDELFQTDKRGDHLPV